MNYLEQLFKIKQKIAKFAKEKEGTEVARIKVQTLLLNLLRVLRRLICADLQGCL